MKRLLRDPFDPGALALHAEGRPLRVGRPRGVERVNSYVRDRLQDATLSRWGYGRTGTESDQTTRQSDQAAALILRSDRNA